MMGLGCDEQVPASSDAGPETCWNGDFPPVNDDCVTDLAMQTNPACAESAFLRLDDPDAKSFQEAAKRTYGAFLDSGVEPNGFLGFYISPRVLVSALHAWQGCIEQRPIRSEYVAGVDGPPIECNGYEVLYVGASARHITPTLSGDYACVEGCKSPTSASSSCYDCEPLETLADIVIARRVVDEGPEPFVLEMANAPPAVGQSVVHFGKPDLPSIVYDERRIAAGRLLGAHGKALRSSAFLVPGFSGGPLLDGCGRAIGISVSRVGDLRVEHPNDWKESEAISVSLSAFRPAVEAALVYDSAHPVR